VSNNLVIAHVAGSTLIRHLVVEEEAVVAEAATALALSATSHFAIASAKSARIFRSVSSDF
jgi:hypothetical protein